MNDITLEKQTQRKIAADIRDALPVGHAAENAAQNFMDRIPLKASDYIALYHPYGSEIDPIPLIGKLNQQGFQTALPVVLQKDQPLVFRLWQMGEALVKGAYGIPVPSEEAAIVTPDVVVVPLLAFDGTGARMGYGGGFYDRTLSALRGAGRVTAVGYAYAAQEFDQVITDALDQRLDWIVTETDVRNIQ